MMKRLILLLLIFSTLPFVLAVEEDNRVNLQDIEYKQLLLQQGAKNEVLIKNELDRRDSLLEQRIDKKIDENFQVLDQRVDRFIKQAGFKLGIVFFSSLVLGGTILLLINNQLKRKRAIKKELVQPGEKIVLSGKTLEKVKEQVNKTEDSLIERGVIKGVVKDFSIADKAIRPMRR